MTQRHPATIVAHAGVAADTDGGISPPLHSSDSYRWEDGDTKPVYDYSRTSNANRDQLANTLAQLEGAAGGVITGSGQSAAMLVLLQLPPGTLVVAPHDCYGGIYRLIAGLERKGLIRALFVDQTDDAAFAAALEHKPGCVWMESPSNPLLRVIDIAARAAQAKAVGALTVIDNTVLTPIRQQPIALGCDYVFHSTTKAINGHNDLFGGAVLARTAEQAEELAWWSNAAGLNSSAYDAWTILKGLRTLPLRIERQEATATKVATFLAAHPKVTKVYYPGLPDFAQRAIVERQQSGPGGLLSFELAGDAAAFVKGLDLVTLAPSLGGFATLVCRVATMTHRGMPPEAQRAAGIAPDLLRLSIGLEEADDIIADLKAGFAAIG